MDNEIKYIDTQKVDYRIQNRKRGEILNYSMDQVAALLNEDIGNIKYYISIFDDLLKLQIVGKELRFTNNDVDRLEFLIKLKNTGMTLKEIQDYYNKLPLNDTEVQHSESNLLSVEELIDSIKEELQTQFNNLDLTDSIKEELQTQFNNLDLIDPIKEEIQIQFNSLELIDPIKEEMKIQFNNLDLIDLVKEELQTQFSNFKVQIINDIRNANSLYIQNISSTIIEAQNKSLNKLQQDLSKEIKEYINSKFDNVNEINKNSNNKLFTNTTEFISKKIDSKYDELKLNLQNDSNTFAESSLTNNLAKEIKDLKTVLEAFSIQHEMEMSNEKTGFLNNLLQITKPKK